MNWALLVGSIPRKAGMERRDLLGINGKIFIGQGQAIEKNAASDVRVLVVGNPCNTNCLIAMNNAKSIPRDRWFAMTRLDENRAKAQLAQKAGVDMTAVSNMTIWGNHSATQYPDFYNAKINGKTADKVISDESVAEGNFHPGGATARCCDHQGARLVLRRPPRPTRSSTRSASLTTDTRKRRLAQRRGLLRRQLRRGKGLISSFPVRTSGGKWEIVQDVPINDFSRSKIDASVTELKEEKSLVGELIG